MAELGNAFEALGNKMTEQEIKAMIDASDNDPDADLRSAFDLCDEDNSGKISKAELAGLFKKLGEEVTDDEVRAMLNDADKNDDALIDFDEFKQLM